MSKNIKCELCNSEATNICYNCKMYLCESCYKFIHDKNESKKVHRKENIDYNVPINIKCQKHPDNFNNLFCTNEKGI